MASLGLLDLTFMAYARLSFEHNELSPSYCRVNDQIIACNSLFWLHYKLVSVKYLVAGDLHNLTKLIFGIYLDSCVLQTTR